MYMLYKHSVTCVVLDQEDRQWVVREFKEHRKDVLVATDVASKGLDFTARHQLRHAN